MDNRNEFEDECQSITYVTNIQLKLNLNDINSRF